MEIPSEKNESQTLRKLKQFYNSCVNTAQRTDDKTQSLQDWFNEMNLSFVSFDEPFETSWKTLSSRLEEYGIHTILIPSFKGTVNTPIEIIEIDCNAPLLQPDVYLNPSTDANAYTLSLYRELITESVEFLGSNMDTTQRQEFVNNVLQMETDIARAIQTSEFRENILSEGHIQHIKEIWRSQIGDSIQEMEVISSCKYNLGSMLSVLDNATTKTSTTYVAWRMLFQILPHLGKGLREVPYKIGLPFWDREYEFTWQECAHHLQEEMGLPVFKAMLDAGYIRKERIQEVKESFKETKRNFLLTFKTIDWAGALIKKLFLSKVKNMKLNLGYPEFINQSELDTIFMNLEFEENYFKNVLNLKMFKTRYFFNRLWYGISENPISEISLEHNSFGNNARYDYTKNTVYINLGLLRNPIDLYSEDIPKYLRFGEISLLARQMSHAFDTTGCFYDGKGKMWERMWWPQTLVQKYDFYTDCLRTQMQNKTSMDVNNNETLNTIVADIGSFLVPYDGLLSHLSLYQNEELLPGLTLTKKQIYYVRIAQSYCKSESFPKEDNLMKSSRYRVNTAVSNLKDFGEVFNCPPTSILNPAVKCNLL